MATRKRSLEQSRAEGTKASTFLDDPFFKRVIQGVKNEIHAEIDNCGTNQGKEVLNLHSELTILGRITARIKRYVHDGKRAEIIQAAENAEESK